MPQFSPSSARFSLFNFQVDIVPFLFLRPIPHRRFLLSDFTIFFGLLEGTSILAPTPLYWRSNCVRCMYFIPLLEKLINLQNKHISRVKPNSISVSYKLSTYWNIISPCGAYAKSFHKLNSLLAFPVHIYWSSL